MLELERKAEREGLEEVMVNAMGEDGEEERVRVFAAKKEKRVVVGGKHGGKGEQMEVGEKVMKRKQRKEKKGGEWACVVC